MMSPRETASLGLTEPSTLGLDTQRHLKSLIECANLLWTKGGHAGSQVRLGHEHEEIASYRRADTDTILWLKDNLGFQTQYFAVYGRAYNVLKLPVLGDEVPSYDDVVSGFVATLTNGFRGSKNVPTSH